MIIMMIVSMKTIIMIIVMITIIGNVKGVGIKGVLKFCSRFRIRQ